MTTIGSTNYSYFTYSGLTRGNAQADAADIGQNSPSTRNSINGTLTGAQIGNDDASSAKLSSALWDLASTTTASAKDEAVWQGASESRTRSEKEFGDLADMDVAELIRAKYLKAHNMTEESLAQMDPEERAAIEAEIREAVKQALGMQTEQNGDTADATQVSAGN